jgi:hypothetical protein
VGDRRGGGPTGVYFMNRVWTKFTDRNLTWPILSL